MKVSCAEKKKKKKNKKKKKMKKKHFHLSEIPKQDATHNTKRKGDALFKVSH